MKKQLAWILVLCMVFSLLPISALAADPAASYVVFHDEDGNVIDSVASPAKAIDYAPAVSGNKMLGWTLTQGSADVDFAVGADVTAEAADVALFPVVDDGVYVIHFYENDGGVETPEGSGGASYTSAQYVEKGGKAVKPDDPSRPGFEFTGWFADADCKVPFDFSAPVADNAAVYAGWKKVDVPFAVVVWMQKVTDDKNATDAQKTYDFGTSYVIDGAAWIQEFSFDQVNAMLREANLAKLNIKGFHFNADKTDDKVTTNRYGTAVLNVYYDRDLMTMKFGKNVVMTGLYGAKVTESGEGYRWPEGLWQYTNDEGNNVGMSYLGEFIFPDDNAGGNTMQFTVRRVENEIKLGITFELEQLNGSYQPDASDVVGLVYDEYYGPSYRKFTFSEKYNGYEVTAYSKAADGTRVPVEVNDSVRLVDLNSDKLFVYYNLKSYELNYFLNGGSMEGNQKESVKYTTPLAGFDRAASRQGYNFAGWYADPDLTTKFSFAGSTMPAANLAVYAKWDRIWYHVKAVVGDDVVIPNEQTTDFYVEYGESVDGTSFEAAARPGYELDGWYLSDAEGNPADPYQFGVALNEGTKGFVTEDGEQVLYIAPKWVKNPDAFTVSYDVNGGAGEIKDSNFYLKGANAIVTAEKPTAPAGYQFEGWAKTSDASKAEFTARELTDEIQGDLTLYAVYCPIQVGYTIEYYYDGVKDESATVNGSADFGSTVQYPDKAKDGFVFESADPEKLVIDLDPAKNLQKVYYVTDTWNDEEDDPHKPDGIPDKYQVLVNYKADENGKVTGREAEIITLVDAEGKYVTSGDITTAGSEAQGNEGYAFDFWTDPAERPSDDGVYAFTGVDGGSTIDIIAHFDKDNWNDKEDDPSKPDGIPDKYQVLVNYKADENGKVTGRQAEVITLVDAEGNYVQSGDVVTSGSEAQGDPGFSLEKWTDPENNTSADGVFTFTGVAGGSTIDVTAHFTTDNWNDEEDDPHKPDGIPDKYQVLVNYKADENGKVTGREAEIFTLVDAEGNYVQSGDITTAGSEAKGNEGYAFDFWTDPAERPSDDGVYAFTGVAGGSTIDIIAHFDKDSWNDKEDDPDKPDGIPDKYQVLVNYKADENGKVTGREAEVFTLVDAEGNYVKSGDITTSGSEAQANEDYKFVNWTDPAERPSSDGVFAIPGVAGGSTVVITAHFAKQAEQKLVKVWDDKDDIDQIRPDSVKVDLKQGDKVVKADVELKAEDDWTYVWYGDGEWTVEEKDVAEGYTAEVTKGEDGSYVLTNTHVVIPELEKEDHFGYIIGRQVGDKVLIQPEANVTRAEVVTVFFRLLTDESRDKYWSSTNDFTDVAATSWFNNAVSTMTRAGVINGYPDGTFHPNDPITRAELATIAVRFFELQKSDKNIFSDTEGHWAVQFINAAAENNLITGYPDGTFKPNQNIIRAEFITVVNRMIERKPDKQHLLPKDQMINWDDNPENAWYYEQVQEATNSHEYEWITVMNEQGEGVVIENWTKPLPMRDWVQLEKEWSDAHSGGNPGEVIEP